MEYKIHGLYGTGVFIRGEASLPHLAEERIVQVIKNILLIREKGAIHWVYIVIET